MEGPGFVKNAKVSGKSRIKVLVSLRLPISTFFSKITILKGAKNSKRLIFFSGDKCLFMGLLFDVLGPSLKVSIVPLLHLNFQAFR